MVPIMRNLLDMTQRLWLHLKCELVSGVHTHRVERQATQSASGQPASFHPHLNLLHEDSVGSLRLPQQAV